MELTMENAAEYTEYMFREYYYLNTQPFFSALDTDVMWIGPGNLFVFGKMAAKNYFKDGFIMPCIELEDVEFYQLPAEKIRSLSLADLPLTPLRGLIKWWRPVRE